MKIEYVKGKVRRKHKQLMKASSNKGNHYDAMLLNQTALLISKAHTTQVAGIDKVLQCQQRTIVKTTICKIEIAKLVCIFSVAFKHVKYFLSIRCSAFGFSFSSSPFTSQE